MIKILRILVVWCLVSGGLALGADTVYIRRERTPEREYWQRGPTGNYEKVKEYRNGVTVKEGFRYEEGKGIIKYNEPVQPKPKDPDTKRGK